MDNEEDYERWIDAIIMAGRNYNPRITLVTLLEKYSPAPQEAEGDKPNGYERNT